MEQNKSCKDTDRIYGIFTIIVIFIAIGAATLLKDLGCAIICWVLYFIYSAIHTEIQYNHNKLIDFIDNNTEHNKEK